jgi:hypothetical protein
MSKHSDALEAYFRTWDDFGRAGVFDAAMEALRQASPLAYAAVDKACGITSIAQVYIPLEKTQEAMRAYLALLETLDGIRSDVPWVDIMNGPSRVWTDYERSIAARTVPGAPLVK